MEKTMKLEETVELLEEVAKSKYVVPFCFDTGASAHFISNRALVNLEGKTPKGDVHIKTACGNSTAGMRCKTVPLESNCCQLLLEDVVYSDQLNKNLISWNKLKAAKFTVDSQLSKLYLPGRREFIPIIEKDGLLWIYLECTHEEFLLHTMVKSVYPVTKEIESSSATERLDNARIVNEDRPQRDKAAKADLNAIYENLDKNIELNNAEEAQRAHELLTHYRLGHMTKLKQVLCEACLKVKGSKDCHKKENEHKPQSHNDSFSWDTVGKLEKGFKNEEYTINISLEPH